MRRVGYLLVKKFGSARLVALVSWFICVLHFLFSKEKRRQSLRFYRTIFPGRSLKHYLTCTWHQFRNFSLHFSDRMALSNPKSIQYEICGSSDDVERVLSNGKGCMVVMSHVGDWEIAARLMCGTNRPLMLYMGVRKGEQIESVQKDEMKKSGITLITATEGEVSPLAVMEGIEYMRSGGLVTMTGDRVWPGSSQDGCVKLPFLGGTATFPKIPYIMAAVADVPVYFFFGFKTGEKKYLIKLSPAFRIPSARSERNRAVMETVTAYAGMLESVAREYPFQWYHFESFVSMD